MKIKRKIDTIFFGRKFNYLEKSRRIFILKVYFFILLLLLTLLIFVISFSVYSMYPFQNSVKIDYSDLSPEQQIVAKEIISELKPLYLRPQVSITFYKTMTDKCGDCNKVDDGLRIFGLNQRKNIKLEYVEDKDMLKNILCHELVHTFAYSPQEEFVYDVSDYYVCYKDEFNPILESVSEKPHAF